MPTTIRGLVSTYTELLHRYGVGSQQARDYIYHHQDNGEFIQLAESANHLKLLVDQSVAKQRPPVWQPRTETPPAGRVWATDGYDVWLMFADGKPLHPLAHNVKWWTPAVIPMPPTQNPVLPVTTTPEQQGDSEYTKLVQNRNAYMMWGDLDKPFHRPECGCKGCEEWRTRKGRPTHQKLREMDAK